MSEIERTVILTIDIYGETVQASLSKEMVELRVAENVICAGREHLALLRKFVLDCELELSKIDGEGNQHD